VAQQDRYQQRQKALRDIAKRRGLAAIVIIGGTNLSYFSGFGAAERSMARPMLFVVPAEGEPVLVAHRFRTQLLEAHSPVERVVFYSQLSRPPVEALLQALADVGAAEGRIGFELTNESQIFMSYGDFDAVRQAIGPDRIEDVAKETWLIRFRRDAVEIAAQKRAAEAVTGLISECWDFVRGGMQQRELTGFIRKRVTEEGWGAHYAIVSAGPGNYDFCGAWTPDHSFAEGEMVWIDLGVEIGGMCAAYSRAGVVGGPSAEQVRVAAAVAQATAIGVDTCGPNVHMSAVATACETALAGIDAPISSDIAWFGTRFGHGMGIEFIEPPHIAAYDDTVLEPGMVLAVEPGIATPFGRFHFRQLALVTDEGRELLPAPPMELAFLKSR
jgi:Xaa-Pro aminopeptidase